MADVDWRNNLFQGSDRLRGLSGGGADALALDDANSFYNFRLRRHAIGADLARHPERVWSPSHERAGLWAHVTDAVADRQRFTDVLLILSDDDWREAAAADPRFAARFEHVLRGRFDAWLRETGVPGPSRPLGVQVLRDGDPAVGGTRFGLAAGECITGVLPNLYRGPGRRSRPLISLLVHIPGVDTGYREVGRLYDDQVLFTLGNHWLDNFSHPKLKEAAVYRLQRDADGAFLQVLNPDLLDRYFVTSTDQDGTSILTLATYEGEALAYIVFQALAGDEEAPDAHDDPAPSLHDGPALPPLLDADLGLPEPQASVDPFDLGPALDLEPDLGLPLADPPAGPAPASLEPAPAAFEALDPPRSSARSLGGPGTRTIIPEAHQERIFTLQERGALLQKVHFGAFMLGYDVYVGHRGELGTVVDQPAATFQVRKKTVSLLANAAGVRLDGEPVPQGESRLIEGDAVLQVGSQRLEYRELRGVKVEGWPYVGEIRRPASSTYMLWGRAYTIGRSGECRVVLPDEPRNDNIVWKPSVDEGSIIRSKTGEIPKARFYTDSIMVGTEHAAIELLDDEPQLVTRARHCFAFIRRDGEVMSLWPTSADHQRQRLPLAPGDEVLIGNCLFHVGYSQKDATVTAPAPAPRVSAASLVDAVSAPDDLPLPARLLDDDPLALPDVDPEDPPPPPPVEPEAERSLRAAARSRPDVHELYDATDAPDPGRVSGARAVGAPEAPVRVPPPTPEPLAVPRTTTAEGVVVVDERDAQFELGRPARLVLVGWAVNGTVTCGNHEGADVVLPENRIHDGQRFSPTTYFELRVRGARSCLSRVDAREVRIDGEAPAPAYDDLGGRVVSVLRRDDDGEVDFPVDLQVREDADLPDPRSRLLAVNADEPLVVALLTRGFPVRAPRTLVLHGLTFTGTFDGQRLQVAEYLPGYRTERGFRPFFVQSGGGRFRTAPEDGSPFELAPGDRVVIDGAVFRFDVP